jgi:hypothetical protein
MPLEEVTHSPVRRVHTPTKISRETNDNMPRDEYNEKPLIVTPTYNTHDSLLTTFDSSLCSMDLCMSLDSVNICMGPVIEESERGLLTREGYPTTVISPSREAKAPTPTQQQEPCFQRRGRFLVWPVAASPMSTAGTRS